MYDEEAAQTDLGGIELFRIYRARVSNNPANIAADLFVTIPSIDGEQDPRGFHQHGPVKGWDKRSDATLPTSGVPATVFVDDVGDYWLVNWSPT